MSDFNQKNNRAVWFDIPVVDLERATRFYSRVLAIEVSLESFGEFRFSVFEHESGNGGCLVPNPAEVSRIGVLLYLNADGRLRDAVAEVAKCGGTVVEDVHPIGPHGFRAIVFDSEGNRVALHSSIDG